MTTTYPPIIDTWTNKQDGVDLIIAADLNQAHERIIKIQEVLGINPHGESATVGARITAIEEAAPPPARPSGAWIRLVEPTDTVSPTFTVEVSHAF